MLTSAIPVRLRRSVAAGSALLLQPFHAGPKFQPNNNEPDVVPRHRIGPRLWQWRVPFARGASEAYESATGTQKSFSSDYAAHVRIECGCPWLV